MEKSTAHAGRRPAHAIGWTTASHWPLSGVMEAYPGHLYGACLTREEGNVKRRTNIKTTLASSVVTARCPARSALLPASAMIMLGLPCRCSSFTQFFALVKLSALVMSNTTTAAAAPLPPTTSPSAPALR